MSVRKSLDMFLDCYFRHRQLRHVKRESKIYYIDNSGSVGIRIPKGPNSLKTIFITINVSDLREVLKTIDNFNG